jgi:hypothetical protein
MYEGPQLSAAMRAGKDDATHAPRPDMTVQFGDRSIRIEAKRLAATGDLPRRYVEAGMMRFLDGRYTSSVGLPAIMFAYAVPASPPLDVIKPVNKVVESHPRMGTTHQLQPASDTTQAHREYRSDHGAALYILHFVVYL